ncbi:hypothetical protein DPMN_172987 [Dreissena polymorpha]|uniref:G-protein coupled receptors family 1 profile domain-containing protein n=1 Tax=Dreissena polymorpha TaxID=45954 RepID=A0A9D4E486_DREPO|nr:hypothetical protein DPMN_172987 [Dreissena polymorpha]
MEQPAFLNNVTNVSYNQDLDLIQCTRYPAFFVTSVIVGIIVSLTTFFGNALILIAIRRFPAQFKGSLFMLIRNLAAADILLAFGMNLHLVGICFNAWNTSENVIFCAIKKSIVSSSLVCSGLTLMLVSLDRFCAIVFPLRHMIRHRRKKIWTAISMTWVISIATMAFPTMNSMVTNSHGPVLCRFGTTVPRDAALGAVGFLLLQVIFNSVLFIAVILKVRYSNEQKDIWIAKKHATTNSKGSTISSKSKLMAKVYVIFAICWFPFITTTLLLETDVSIEKRIRYSCIREYSLHLGFINSGLNWIVYGLANNRFREAFKQILRCAVSKASRSPYRLIT